MQLLNILKKRYYIFWLIFSFGILFRILNFPNIPSGLNQDEVAAGYEAFSILTSGTDKWGNIFPVYFPAWGSGQSVLLSYLQIPFIAIFGLNILAIRLPSLILGILILPLIYQLTKLWFDQKTAYISLLLASILPWPTMISRWGLEANILPFFIILGLYLITINLELSKKEVLNLKDKFLILVTFLPFSISLYSYGLYLIPISIFLLVCIIGFRKQLFKHKFLAISSIIISAFAALPFGLFIIKNNILTRDLFFEKFLPFSIPLLNTNRLEQINDGFLTTFATNFYFIIAGFPDSLSWNNDSVFLPLGLFVFPFLVLAIYFLIQQKYFTLKHFKFNSTALIPVIWLASFAPLLIFIPMNTTRTNGILYVVIILISFGIVEVNKALKTSIFNKYFLKIILIWIIFYGLAFQFSYQFLYPKKVAAEFNQDIQKTLQIATDKSLPGEQIYLTKEVLINYVFPLFVFKVSPDEFRNNADIELNKNGYNVYRYKNFVYDKDYLKLEKNTTWIAILKPCENNWCDQNATLNDSKKCYRNQELYQDSVWKVVRCFAN